MAFEQSYLTSRSKNSIQTIPELISYIYKNVHINTHNYINPLISKLSYLTLPKTQHLAINENDPEIYSTANFRTLNCKNILFFLKKCPKIPYFTCHPALYIA